MKWLEALRYIPVLVNILTVVSNVISGGSVEDLVVKFHYKGRDVHLHIDLHQDHTH